MGTNRVEGEGARDLLGTEQSVLSHMLFMKEKICS